MKKELVLILAIIIAGISQAQENQDEKKLSFNAYLDVYYTYDFSEPDPNQRQYVTQVANHNEFNINLALLKASYETDKFRSNLALQVGTYPAINYAEPSGLAQAINEANFGVKVGTNSWIDVGIMSGHFGYESVFSFDNELYSQALATEYTPYYQTGIQYTNELNEKLNLRLVILNGWQNIFETNSAKAFGGALDYKHSESLMLSYGNFFGKEPFGADDEFRMHHNFFMSYTEGKFDVTGVLDMTFQNPDQIFTTPVFFFTFITEYNISEKISVAGRFENVKDERGVLITNDFQTNILTFGFNWSVNEFVKFRSEFRTFFGNEDIWIDGDTGEINNSNQVISLGLVARI